MDNKDVVITDPLDPMFIPEPMEPDFTKARKPISVAYLQYAKSDMGYTVKALDDTQMTHCSTRYDAMNALREATMKSMTVGSVHHNSTNWGIRDLRDEMKKSMSDGFDLHGAHENIHAQASENPEPEDVLLHHMICHRAEEMGAPIDCDGGELSSPVIAGYEPNKEINEAVASGLISEDDGKQAIEDGITHANIYNMLDSDGEYAVIIPVADESAEIAKALGFNENGLVIPFLDFLKADSASVPKVLTDIVDDGKPDQYTLAPFYLANSIDGHGEWVEERDLEKAVNEWSLMSPNRNVYLQHSEELVCGTWTQLIVMPWEFDAEMRRADGSTYMQHFPKGSVLIGVVWKDWAWEMILDGRLTGMSMGGMAIEKYDQEIPNS